MMRASRAGRPLQSVFSRILTGRLSMRRQTAMLGLALVLPVVLYLLVTQAYPFISALLTSLTDKRIGAPGEFIGLGNYVDLVQDETFLHAVRNSILFTASSILLKLVFGVVMALVLNQELRFRSLWRALLFLPWTIPTIVTVLTFQWMYSATGGVINSVLLRTDLLHRPIDWLGVPLNAMAAVVIVNVWRGTPFFGISLLGALQGISREQYEAAETDGANVLQRFLYVTIPGIRDVALLVTLVSTIWTLNDFQIIWVLTRGGPADATQVFATLTYTSAFLNLDLARGIAISMASVPLLVLLIIGTARSVPRQEA